MAVYPNESWPAESVIVGLDGTVDGKTGLPFIAKGTSPTSVPSYEVQYNRRQMRQNQILAGWRQGMVVDEGGLAIGVYPLEFTIGGVRRSFEGATAQAIPDNATRCVYLDSAGTLQIAAAWPGELASHLPLAQVVTTNGAVGITDKRVLTVFSVEAARRVVLCVNRSQVSSNQTAVKLFEFDPMENLVLQEVQVFCTAAAATASVDVRKNGSTMLSSPATPVASSVVKPGIADSVLPGTASLSVHATTNGTGSISELHVTLLLAVAA